MFRLLRKLFSKWSTKRRMTAYIRLATEALYSEQFDLANVVQQISGNDRSINLTLAYIAAKAAAGLNEPLSNTDVDCALEELTTLLRDVELLSKVVDEMS